MSNSSKCTSKIYNGFSKSNINTNNSICIGFFIIGCVLLINSVLSLATIVEGVAPLIACLCSAGAIILSYLSSRFAFNLLRDYNESIEEAGEEKR